MTTTIELTDEQVEALEPLVMALPGMTTDHESDFICEPHMPGEMYFKFMSDHGVTDDQNGTVFGDYLRANACNVEQHRPRSMTVPVDDLIRIFNL